MATWEDRQKKNSEADQGQIPAVMLLQILIDGEASSGEVRLRETRRRRSKRGIFQVGILVLVIAAASALALVGFGVLSLTR